MEKSKEGGGWVRGANFPITGSITLEDEHGSYLVVGIGKRGSHARYVTPQESGPLQEVVSDDARASSSPRQTTIQDYVKEQQGKGQPVPDAQKTLSKTKAPKRTSSKKVRKKTNASKTTK